MPSSNSIPIQSELSTNLEVEAEVRNSLRLGAGQTIEHHIHTLYLYTIHVYRLDSNYPQGIILDSSFTFSFQK